MNDYDFPLWEPSRKYVCPLDASPSTRELYEMGYDVAALEDNLKRSPEERLARNDRLANDFLKREESFTILRRGKSLVERIEASRRI